MSLSSSSNSCWSAPRAGFSDRRSRPGTGEKTRRLSQRLAAGCSCFSCHPTRRIAIDELVWKHLKADTVGRTKPTSRARWLPPCAVYKEPGKICSFFQKPSLRYAAGDELTYGPFTSRAQSPHLPAVASIRHVPRRQRQSESPPSDRRWNAAADRSHSAFRHQNRRASPARASVPAIGCRVQYAAPVVHCPPRLAPASP